MKEDQALIRELKEETGYCVKNEGNIGICDFILPWSWDNSDYTHHICAFYHITIQSGTLDLNPEQFTGQDSKGACWIKMDDFNVGNSSPLVLKVVEYFTKKVLILKVFIVKIGLLKTEL